MADRVHIKTSDGTKSVTRSQLAFLRWLANNPGKDTLDWMQARNGSNSGMSLVAQRGAAGSFFWRLAEQGLVDGAKRAPVLTRAGRQVVSRG